MFSHFITTLSDLSCSCAQLSDIACFHPFRIPYLCHIGSQSGGNVFSMLLSLPVSTHMITVPVVRYSRNKKIGDKNSPLIYLLRPKPGDAKIYTIDLLASEIEAIGSLSVEDVIHVMKSFVRAMRKVLVSGDKVKVDGLGIFYTSLTCPGVEVEKDCTVKNIKRVNLRFKVDNTLRLVNDSTADTRGGNNNISFEIVSPDAKSNDNGNGGGDGEGEDPAA